MSDTNENNENNENNESLNQLDDILDNVLNNADIENQINNEDDIDIEIDDDIQIDDDDMERCSICLDFQNCDSIPMECCNKLIHTYCLNQWLSRRNNCPLCRTQQSSYYNGLGSDNSLGFEIDRPRFTEAVSEMMDNLISESAQRVRRYESIGVSIARDINMDEPERVPLLAPRNLFRRRHRPLFNPLFSDFHRRSIFNYEEPVFNNMAFDIPRINHDIGVTSFEFNYEEDIDLDFDLGVTNNNIGVSIMRQHINNMREIDDILIGITNNYSNVMNNMEIEENEDRIGITFDNRDLGMTSMRMEVDQENNININFGDINMNFNMNMNDNPLTSLNNLLQNIRQEILTLNRNLDELNRNRE